MPTVINDIDHVEVEAALDDRWAMQPAEFERLTGWTLKPEGLCRGDVCAPIFERDRVVTLDGQIDLAEAAPLIGLSAVADVERGVAALTASASSRGNDMLTLDAPEFTLPDCDGSAVSLADFAGKKVLLLAWASW